MAAFRPRQPGFPIESTDPLCLSGVSAAKKNWPQSSIRLKSLKIFIFIENLYQIHSSQEQPGRRPQQKSRSDKNPEQKAHCGISVFASCAQGMGSTMGVEQPATVFSVLAKEASVVTQCPVSQCIRARLFKGLLARLTHALPQASPGAPVADEGAIWRRFLRGDGAPSFTITTCRTRSTRRILKFQTLPGQQSAHRLAA